MARTASIGLRVEPDLKKAAEKAAAADNRTLASWIELLMKDALQKPKRAK